MLEDVHVSKSESHSSGRTHADCWREGDVTISESKIMSRGSCGIETGDYWTSLRVVLSSLIPLPCFLSCLYECSESCVVIWAVFTVFRVDFRLWKLLYPFVRINSSIIKVSRWNSNQSHIRTSTSSMKCQHPLSTSLVLSLSLPYLQLLPPLVLNSLELPEGSNQFLVRCLPQIADVPVRIKTVESLILSK